MGEKRVVKKIIWRVLVIACMAAIFCFSSQNGDESQETSGGFTYNVLSVFPQFRALDGAAQDEIVEGVQRFVRKWAHFSIYALLGFLIFWLVRSGYGRRILQSIVIAPIGGAVYAVTDEVHQLFVPDRTCAAVDVFIDFCGAFCGALFAALVACLIKAAVERRKRSNG